MRFVNSEFFLLYLIIPLVVIYSRKFGAHVRFSSIELVKRIQRRVRFHPRLILGFIRMTCLFLIVIALARPQTGKMFSEISSEGVDIFLVLDTSGSMQALDFELNGKRTSRLEVVKDVVIEFVKRRSHDRMGLVVFGEEAFTQCPLTLDHGILVDFVKKLEIGMAGDSTAIGSALGIAVNRMKDLKAKSKVLILLTDGRNNSGQMAPQKAAEIAQSLGIKIYTIGVGTMGKAPFLVDTIFGKQYVYEQVDMDEETLTAIANITQSKYYRATDTDNLRNIYQEIDRLETTEAKVKEYTEYSERFHYFIIMALVCLLVEIVLRQTRLRTIP